MTNPEKPNDNTSLPIESNDDAFATGEDSTDTDPAEHFQKVDEDKEENLLSSANDRWRGDPEIDRMNLVQRALRDAKRRR